MGESSTAKARGDASEVPFERAIERLEEIVDSLEGGDLPLEQALEAFEEGVGLSRRCASQLEAAERRIEVLVDGAEGLQTEPFEGSDEGEDA